MLCDTLHTFIAINTFYLLGDVCLSPKVQSEVYTTTEAPMSAETVVIVEFSVSCKNGLKVCQHQNVQPYLTMLKPAFFLKLLFGLQRNTGSV